MRDRVAELGAKADAGTQTPEETRDYDTFIKAADRITALQLKARRQLSAVR